MIDRELADGNSYPSEDIEAIVRREWKYPSVSDQMTTLVIDILQRAVTFFSSKLIEEGFDSFGLVITRRKPKWR
jgi:hypothetical protein